METEEHIFFLLAPNSVWWWRPKPTTKLGWGDLKLWSMRTLAWRTPLSRHAATPPQFSIALCMRLESGDSMCCQGTAKLSWPRLPHRGCWRFQP
jgi:hypothetical protein